MLYTVLLFRPNVATSGLVNRLPEVGLPLAIDKDSTRLDRASG